MCVLMSDADHETISPLLGLTGILKWRCGKISHRFFENNFLS